MQQESRKDCLSACEGMQQGKEKRGYCKATEKTLYLHARAYSKADGKTH